jgi:uncharacterized protein (TIGR03067 family)
MAWPGNGQRRAGHAQDTFVVVVIRGDRATVKQLHKDRQKILGQVSFQIDPTAKPKSLDLLQISPKQEDPETVPGIYELNGDKLKLAFGESERPTDFEGERTLTLKRTKK